MASLLEHKPSVKTSDREFPIPGKRKVPLVIIVDDDKTILRSLNIALSGRYMVHTCDRPVTSVSDVHKYKPDLILLDIRMPERDGFWVFSEIKKFNPDVPIIFNSAYQDRLDNKDVEGVYKPFAYLPKSGRLDDIIDTFERAIESIDWRPG